jgi:plasmid stability protein
MAQLIVRKVADELARSLKIRAAQHGRSAEAEHRLILEQALGGETTDFWARADKLRRASIRQRSDSAALLREMRDSR